MTDQTRVMFRLARRYYEQGSSHNGMRLETCAKIMQESFGYCPTDRIKAWQGYLSRCLRNREEVEIVCTPSQFAHFIIKRCEAGECINGIKDLEPYLFQYKDRYTRIAEVAKVDREDVKRVLQTLSFHWENVDCPGTAKTYDGALDVSENDQ